MLYKLNINKILLENTKNNKNTNMEIEKKNINPNMEIEIDNEEIDNEEKDLIIKKYTFNNVEYKIIKYNKKRLKFYQDNDYDKFEELKNYRSVIVRNNKIVSFSPQKSINYNIFKNKYKEISELWIEDFIDGTMINVFYDVINEVWEIATKSTVGGNMIFFNDLKNYKFYDSNNYFKDYYDMTFRSMFFETCNSNNFNLNTLDKKYTYTFVMQHPFNRIVTPIIIPLLYLIKVYEINNVNDLVEIKELDVSRFINTPPYIFLNTNVKIIEKIIINSYDYIENIYNSDNIPYYCVGCMIYSKDGSRTKLRNKKYEEVRLLRGNQPKLQYNYLCLKKENKVKEFLNYYPEHTIMFNKFKILIYSYTNELYINYISCFIRKEKPLKEYDFQYKTHMYKLHQKYKNELKPNKKYIDKKYVIDYVNSLHPAQQMFIINYVKKNEYINSITNLEIPNTNLEIPNTNLEIPNTNLEIPNTNLEIPNTNLEIPNTNMEIPNTNMEIPNTNMDID